MWAEILYLGSAFVFATLVWFFVVPKIEEIRKKYLEPWSRRHFK